MKRTLVYMSHPISGEFEANIHNGMLWYRFLRSLSAAGIARLLGEVEKKVEPVGKIYTMKELHPPRDTEYSFLIQRPFAEPPIILAPWLCCPVPDHKYPGGRAKAMSDCVGTISICDELWHLGGRISDGMRDEGEKARQVRDLCHWGETPPIWEDTSLFA